MRATCQARPPWSIVPLAAFLENKLDRRYLITSIIIILDRINQFFYLLPTQGRHWNPPRCSILLKSYMILSNEWPKDNVWKDLELESFFLVMVIDLPLFRLKRFSQVSQRTLLPTMDNSGSTRVTLYMIYLSQYDRYSMIWYSITDLNILFAGIIEYSKLLSRMIWYIIFYDSVMQYDIILRYLYTSQVHSFPLGALFLRCMIVRRSWIHRSHCSTVASVENFWRKEG